MGLSDARRFFDFAQNDIGELRITMALLRPHEVIKMGCCLPVGSCTCQAYPPPPPGPMDTGPASECGVTFGSVAFAG